MTEIMDIWNCGAHVYDDQVRNFIPFHRSHEIIIDLLPKNKPLHILELGSGTGIVAAKILKAIPSSSVTCVDFSAGMIEECKRRLAPLGSRADFIRADFTTWDAKRTYDAVVTCNALIYKGINADDCYAKYAERLTPGGVFLNATLVTYDYSAYPPDIIASLIKPSTRKEAVDFAQGPGRRIAHLGEDSLIALLSIQDHIGSMARAGMNAFCPWQYLCMSVIMGRK